MDLSASAPSHSLTSTPVPPTPPPLPTDLTPFLKAQGRKAPSPVASQGSFALSPHMVFRTPFEEVRLQLGHTPASLPLCQSPHPIPCSSFKSPLPASLLQYNREKEIAQTSHISKPEVLFCTEPEPIKSAPQVPPLHKLNVQDNQTSRIPDIELQVKDPYDELLSIIMNGCTSTDDADFSRLPLADSPSAPITKASQSRFQLKTEDFHQPVGQTTAISPVSESAGIGRLQVQLHPPATTEPLCITWGGQSDTLNEQPGQSQSPPLVERSGYSELFIEEEEDSREDKVEDIGYCNERLSPQVEHGVSCIFSVCIPKGPAREMGETNLNFDFAVVKSL